eukprot:CAMPEP_0198345236 /NCGR_PEP_ID=MMETSP1450-20131203/72890_1 /TAXON_ID=753684 ORGANISM="Madagascaria erythrocladiodes, Strain CCMP3234" /NCGR_SAMPLE_ID=MMETSP1450 /ASSEMBLY_ACC=CAM_ASM_001115 /LENGTH=85 /DNA_ID=CAMNT_0044050565 /DNA_START=233 /DNA_END=488 /DNA_ORIENTATION=+
MTKCGGRVRNDGCHSRYCPPCQAARAVRTNELMIAVEGCQLQLKAALLFLHAIGLQIQLAQASVRDVLGGCLEVVLFDECAERVR